MERTEPSFTILFERSRYTREANYEDAGPRSNRREVFAVAMVAFAFRHDPVFAAHFLKEICGVTRGGDPRDYAIEFQPEHHADLVIYSNDRRKAYVIEFKISAELQLKQNPWNKSFFGRDGYGTKILNDRRWEGFRERTYVVLQNTQLAQRDEIQRGLRCCARRWKDCVPNRPATGLFADVLNSLSELGVPSLKVWKGNRMKLGESIISAVEMNSLLCGISDDFNLSRCQWNIDKDQEDWWFGLDWSARPSHLRQAATVVKPTPGPLGWHGYQQNKKGKPERAVWLYCGSRKQQQLTEKWLAKRLPKPWTKLIRRYEESLYIPAPAQTAGQDHAWFTEIFNHLKDR